MANQLGGHVEDPAADAAAGKRGASRQRRVYKWLTEECNADRSVLMRKLAADNYSAHGGSIKGGTRFACTLHSGCSAGEGAMKRIVQAPINLTGEGPEDQGVRI